MSYFFSKRERKKYHCSSKLLSVHVRYNITLRELIDKMSGISIRQKYACLLYITCQTLEIIMNTACFKINSFFLEICLRTIKTKREGKRYTKIRLLGKIIKCIIDILLFLLNNLSVLLIHK